MGLGMLQLIKMKGPGKIIVVDVRQAALERAKKFGADIVLTPDQVSDELKVTKWEKMDGGIPVVAEVTGYGKALDLAGEMTSVHGTLILWAFTRMGQGQSIWNYGIGKPLQ